MSRAISAVAALGLLLSAPVAAARPVALTGYEEWTFGPDNLIQHSNGHYDEALYQAQVNGAQSE